MNDPLRSLAAAVLYQAFKDARRDPDARRWLASEMAGLYFDFVGIVQAAALDRLRAGKVRAGRQTLYNRTKVQELLP